MSNNYYKDQESVANIAIGLMERGWKVYGYREDQSDSMTDYYSPARWEGIATKNGCTLLVDVKYKNNKSDYPAFSHANPKRCNWHIEKDGEMIAKGKGAYQCDGYLFHSYKDETMSKINAFIDRIEKFIKQPEKVEQTATVENNQITDNDTITLEIVHNEELNGIELYFSDKPIESVRNELKSNGFRWHKMGYWYAKKTQERILFAESLQSIYNDIKNEIETNGSLSDIDITEVTQKDEPITENNLMGRKVFGQWGIGAGWDFGIITEVQTDSIGTDIIIQWEDREESYRTDIKDLVIVDDNTNLDTVGIYLLPIEDLETNQNETVTEEHSKPITTPEGKIQVSKIEFPFSESPVIESGLTVTTFKEAESIIRNAALEAPDNGAYDKTDIVITWEDGTEYKARFDIQYKHSNQLTPIKNHIESYANYIINTDDSWITEEDKQGRIEFLNTYLLEDYTTITPDNKPKGKVIDITNRIQAKQEQDELNKLTDHWLNNILPYMTTEEIDQLRNAYKDDDDQQIERLFTKISLSTAVKRAREELKQN